MKKTYLQIATAVLFSIGAIACGGNADQSNASEEEASQEEHGEMNHSNMSEGEANLLPIPDGASVYFGDIQQKGTVIDSITGEERFIYSIKFNVEGMEVEPAGELNEGKGHHHLIINGEPLARGTVVPADSVNIHYGKGQTETEIELPRGEHRLVMQFADGYHQSYGEQLSATAVLVVE